MGGDGKAERSGTSLPLIFSLPIMPLGTFFLTEDDWERVSSLELTYYYYFLLQTINLQISVQVSYTQFDLILFSSCVTSVYKIAHSDWSKSQVSPFHNL